jgi:hypothetical protein
MITARRPAVLRGREILFRHVGNGADWAFWVPMSGWWQELVACLLARGPQACRAGSRPHVVGEGSSPL